MGLKALDNGYSKLAGFYTDKFVELSKDIFFESLEQDSPTV